MARTLPQNRQDQMRFVDELIHMGSERAHVAFEELAVTSAFQPIYSLSRQRPVGYEGLMRAFDPDSRPVAPPAVFGRLQSQEEIADFDRILRMLHVRNAALQGLTGDWLFLNVHSSVVTNRGGYGDFLPQMFEHCALDPQRVVIELLEDEIPDPAQLERAVSFFKELGCLVAIDDFGAGHSNFDRIWNSNPDIVKLDRSMLQQAVMKPQVQALLPGLVSLLHEAGCLVVLEGIETEREALIAMESDVDLVQGFYFARPALDARAIAPQPESLVSLNQKFHSVARSAIDQQRRNMADWVPHFEACVRDLAAGSPIDRAGTRLAQMPRLLRCYLLDQHGASTAQPVLGPAASLAVTGGRFGGLQSEGGGSFLRRPFFRQALCEPGRVHVSRPYRRLGADARIITLSYGLLSEQGLHVLCVDVECDELG